MIGLKSYLPVLAQHLNTSEAVLYERQRKLTNAGLLVGTNGRGPGSGVRVTPAHVAVMIMAMMATDDLADVGAKVDFLAEARSDQQRCPLTNAPTFGRALELIIASEPFASSVANVAVARSTLEAEISFRPTRSRRLESASFGRQKGAPRTGLQSRYWLPGETVLAISREVAAITLGKRLTAGGKSDPAE